MTGQARDKIAGTCSRASADEADLVSPNRPPHVRRVIHPHSLPERSEGSTTHAGASSSRSRSFAALRKTAGAGTCPDLNLLCKVGLDPSLRSGRLYGWGVYSDVLREVRRWFVL